MTDKTALVTGATGLLGRQVLKAFVRRDWTAKGTGYSRADGTEIFKVNLTSSEDVSKVLETVKYVGTSFTILWITDKSSTSLSGLES